MHLLIVWTYNSIDGMGGGAKKQDPKKAVHLKAALKNLIF